MGLILDTGILIASERRGEFIDDILHKISALTVETDIAISAVTVVELTHGIYRAQSEAQRERRRIFVTGAFQSLVVHPVTFEIAQLAGRIEGERAALGNSIAFEDLVIGATALHLGFDVATFNVKHFKVIPGLKIVSL
jgi:tRNA(fMet)-specific endonuclease VapC